MSEMSGLPSPAPPAGWGYSYLDWFGAYSMALSILAALYHRDRTGEGQWIDASQTEAGIMLTQVPVLDWSANGRAWERSGNRSAYQEAAPQGIYRCAGEDRWIAVTCATEAHWKALADLAGECLADPRFATMAGRLAHHDALDAALSSWTVGFEPYSLMLQLQAAGVPAGVCQTAGDRCDNDPQLRHLGWLTELTGTRIGRWPLAEVPVRMSRTPPYLGGRPDRSTVVRRGQHGDPHRAARDVGRGGGRAHRAGRPLAWRSRPGAGSPPPARSPGAMCPLDVPLDVPARSPRSQRYLRPLGQCVRLVVRGDQVGHVRAGTRRPRRTRHDRTGFRFSWKFRSK
jgi:hypothetical protein